MASQEQNNMADKEKAPAIDSVPNIPAMNLRYGSINKIAMELCITGTLYNWKHVADKLGFSNCEISGHFANFDGCKPAENMLNEWIFKRGGRIPELVKVFKALDLQSCLQELFRDEELQAAIKFFKSSKDDDDDDDDNASSGTESISEYSPFPPSTSNDTLTTCSLVSSEQSTVGNPSFEKLSPQQKSEHKVTKEIKDTEVFQTKDNDLKAKSAENVNKISTSVITFKDWPDLLRSNSEPGVPEKNKIKGKKTFFSRSISVETGKKKHNDKKKTKTTKSKKSNFLSKLILSKSKRSHSSSEVVEVQGHYREDKPKESTNLSPLKEAEIPDNVDMPCQRPVSSSSEDSLPFSPSSPNSLGYESGPECEVSENKSKRIYIICNPAETNVFGKACDLYQVFCKKGYQCNMFALNFNEVLEIGMYRYEMEQFTKADYLFLCVSNELKRIFEESTKDMKIKDDNSKSLRHVSDFMMSFLAMKCCNKDGKIMPILLAEDSRSHIPLFLGNYVSYLWPEQEGRMENTIHRRPEFIIPVSNQREQAPQKVFGLKAA